MQVFLAGGAGFIGSHLVDFFLAKPETQRVTVYDNFSSGQMTHLSDHVTDSRLNVVKADLVAPVLYQALPGHDLVIHLASNPDIARAVTEPDIDFRQGTALTQALLEGMRISGVKRILYASGSGVYGDYGRKPLHEDHAPMEPVSTYGASKLAGEALVASYCHMFDFKGTSFRFANVIGPRQTHGVAYDFIRRLYQTPSELHVLGDGTQDKSYIYVKDVIAALMVADQTRQKPYEVFNVATEDSITVREIADLVVSKMNLAQTCNIQYQTQDRGWKGDVPVIRLDSDRIRSRGWKNSMTTAQAMASAIDSMMQQHKIENHHHAAA